MTGEKQLNGRMNDRVFGVKRSKPAGISDLNNLQNIAIPPPYSLKIPPIFSILYFFIFFKIQSGGASSTPPKN
jgi:hypothetical protein